MYDQMTCKAFGGSFFRLPQLKKYVLHTALLLCPGIDNLFPVATYLPPPLLGGLGSPSLHPYGYRYVCIPRCLPRDQHEGIIELVLVRPMEESFLTLGNRDTRSLCPLRPDPVESQVAAVESIVSRSCGRFRTSSPSPSCRLTVGSNCCSSRDTTLGPRRSPYENGG